MIPIIKNPVDRVVPPRGPTPLRVKPLYPRVSPKCPQQAPPSPQPVLSPRKIGKATNDRLTANKRVFVGNLNTNATSRKDVISMFSCFGDITGISIHKGYAFVQFTNEQEARAACRSIDGKIHAGQKLDCNIASESKNKQNTAGIGSFTSSKIGKATNDRSIANKRVFVGNLNTNATSRKDVISMFNCFGDIAGISIHKGYAFVQFTNEQEARAACRSIDGKIHAGQKLDCNIASEPKNKQNTAGIGRQSTMDELKKPEKIVHDGQSSKQPKMQRNQFEGNQNNGNMLSQNMVGGNHGPDDMNMVATGRMNMMGSNQGPVGMNIMGGLGVGIQMDGMMPGQMMGNAIMYSPSMDISQEIRPGAMMGSFNPGQYLAMESHFMPQGILKVQSSVCYPPMNVPRQSVQERPSGCRTIIIFGTPENCTSTMLREIFEIFGIICKIEIIWWKPCIIIRFEHEKSADLALCMSGYTMKIENKDDKENTGLLRVLYAFNRYDQDEFERREREMRRVHDHEAMISPNELKRNRANSDNVNQTGVQVDYSDDDYTPIRDDKKDFNVFHLPVCRK